jgi:hypothetical protein
MLPAYMGGKPVSTYFHPFFYGKRMLKVGIQFIQHVLGISLTMFLPII